MAGKRGRRAWCKRLAPCVAAGCAALLASACSSAHTGAGRLVPARIVGEVHGRLATDRASDLVAVDFLTTSHGYAVAEDCAAGTNRCVAEIGATVDGGRTFSWRRLGAGAAQSVQFVDPEHGWVLIGTYDEPQRLLGTADGGRTWRVVQRGQAFMGAPTFVSDAVGYAIAPGKGAPGPMDPTALLRSEDGGRTWRQTATDGYSPADADFLTPELGYVTGWRCSSAGGPYGSCQGAILSTSDGGGHWQQVQRIGTTETGNVGTFAVDFLSPETGFAALPNLAGNTMGGGLSALEGTTDGGRTWRPLQPAYQWGASIRAGWPSAPRFVDARLGWIALSPGAGPGAGGVLVTADGGRTFHQYGAADYVAGSLDPVGEVAYAIVAPMATGGWGTALAVIRQDGSVRQVYPATVPSGGLPPQGAEMLVAYGTPSDPRALLLSRDGGRHWNRAGELPGRPGLVSFAGARRGYALIGEQGYRTSDGGRTWRAVGPRLKDPPTYARLFPAGVLVAALPDGTARRSGDSGATWSTAGRLPRGTAWAVSFATAETGLAYLGDGRSPDLYETRDGGRTWRLLLRVPKVPRGEAPGQNLALDAEGFGILQEYGGGGAYLVTHDGGRTWRTLELPELADTAGLTVAGRNLALLAANDRLYRSSDGGRDWRSVAPSFGR